MRLLLDTCAIIWAVSQPESLSELALEALKDAETQVAYSPLSCAEVAWASNRGRICIDRHWKLWFRHYIDLNGWKEVPIDLSIVEEAYSLPEPIHADPVDRILVATSRVKSLTLVTADKKILEYPHVKSLW
jgi:PIN domain nuclease of toxin-antitoxin system